ncbi:molecular chaperone HtpG [Peloplasma aerotolerans]|uniref:Chaperone protein HtpG n=1 Tax=Peloplasma aerotolerans TaxID=3044389 RepID=A0AAW6U839_9MOLU|nr:molecular chaperone HtpG [Mariniplasma sp. M4Ah]MDI6452789.1 molecular chaperone HtpG [Mariniplasma sp. M4Ah]
MAKTKQFKTESQKLLHLMTHSIYTQKEIFLRELISNASDAIDKRHYLSLTDSSIPTDTYEIWLTPNAKDRTLVVADNGIGFTEKELIENLGTIAQSGSKSFLEKIEQKDVDIIGQFGVGFYSAFMVSDKVIVETKSPYSNTGYRWSSKGESSYTIEEIEREEIGTTIILQLRDDDEENEEDFTKFTSEYTLKSLVKKYSDYVRYPINMMIEKKEKEKSTQVKETLNQMTPIWKRSKQDIKPEDMNQFYKHQFNDFEDPLKVIHTNVEGMLTYTALLFIPKKPAFDFYSEHYEKGLQLYTKGVFIQDKNKELIPDYFKFVKGLVDSADLSLNISREMLQHDRQLKKIASHLEKKIKSELENMMLHDRDQYIEFYEAYKTTLKYGIYDQYGLNKEKLQDLIMFQTNKSDDYISFKDYIERKPEEQKAIYYATGKTKQSILSLPQMDIMKENGYEVLLFTEDIDEFMIQVLQNYQDVPFKSVQQGESDLIDDTKKEDLKEKEKENKDILKAIKKALKEKVKDVKLSARLKESAVCLVSGEGLSLEMEKILKQMPNQTDLKADRILEINPDHDLFKALQKIYEVDAKKIDGYASILYHQALLIEGLPIEDPTEFSNNLVKLMIESSKS